MKELSIGKNDDGPASRPVRLKIRSAAARFAAAKIHPPQAHQDQRQASRTRHEAPSTAIRVQLYINDEFFDTPKQENAYLTVNVPKLNIVYEDENILLVDKKPGQAVHPYDGSEYGKTLIDHIQAYLYAKREWRPREENAFTPALCNRIDRNTGGIVIAAKTAEALRVLNQKIKDREIDKRYLCIVHGTPKPAAGHVRRVPI